MRPGLHDVRETCGLAEFARAGSRRVSPRRGMLLEDGVRQVNEAHVKRLAATARAPLGAGLRWDRRDPNIDLRRCA